MKQLLTLFFVLCAVTTYAQKSYTLNSPDRKITVKVDVDKENITYSVKAGETEVLLPSPIALQLATGEVLGKQASVQKAQTITYQGTIKPEFYKKNSIADHYNQLTLSFKGNWQLQFRAYDDGIAYRFVTNRKNDLIVTNEENIYNFPKNYTIYAPFVNSNKPEIEQQYKNSFENLYHIMSVSELPSNKLTILPVMVELDNNRKAVITEADLEDYPGMYLLGTDKENSIKSMYAPYPKTEVQGGHNNLQLLVTERENFIARTKGTRTFPWRVIALSEQDSQLANNDLVYKLAAPSRVADISWVKPGKVAWEWWNDWNLSGVDFRTGINNETYKAYIDFASEKGIEYVILDEGWAVNKKADAFAVVPEIDLKELVAYGRNKNVGIVLWVGYLPMERQMEEVCKHYSEMGIKGFKVDFMDRDDQKIVDFYYRLAETAARHKLFIDYHGAYKPTGLHRTYPNVLNYEGVFGLEQMKWSDPDVDQVTYDVTIPFIRMLAGPLDYTQGAMRNSTKDNYYPDYSNPMSQGTRCRQLAEYVIFESPFNMLCDNPTAYNREPECTKYIATIPTVWENTIVLNGKVGEYITIARQAKNGDWYVGSMTNWDPREFELDLSFLGNGTYKAEIFRDGVNADKVASDYKKETVSIPDNKKLNIRMAPGGGFAMRISQ